MACMNQIRFFVLSLVFALGGCSALFPMQGGPAAPAPLNKAARDASGAVAVAAEGARPAEAQTTQFFKAPNAQVLTQSPAAAGAALAAANAGDPTISAVTLDALPLGQFVNTIFATILKRNVSLDPAVQSRTDLVSLRTGKAQTAEQLAQAAKTVLLAYGVTVNEFDGLVRVVPTSGLGGVLPEIVRGRAQPDVPAGLRPVFYVVELDNTSQANVVSWVRTLFQGRVTVAEDSQRNSIMLIGQSESVASAVEAVRLLDQPSLRGRHTARLTPVFWSATDMASKLTDVLTAQGYNVGQVPSAPAPIIILPIAPINSVVVFAVSEEALNHTLRWARDLDQAPPTASSGKYLTYNVRNTDASALAKTLQEVLGGGAAAAPVSAAGGAGAAVVRSSGPSRVVVNPAANSIIIQSAPSEYQQIYGLLQELDRPARSALIMVTVAEVRLVDKEQLGFNWLIKQFSSGGYRVNGGLGTPPGGAASSASGLALNIATLAGDPRALLTALATTSRVRVLSNPSIVALSGQTATIQSGQDVPILTSQVSNTSSVGNSGASVLQSVQYRNVGIILKVKPVVHAGGRVNLEINQEVSSVAGDPGVGGSPILATRKVETQLSVLDGNSMLIGGLISETRDGGNAGLPLLKDIPLAGALFRSDAHENVDRTELVILITPHVIEDDFDSRSVTEAFRAQLPWAQSLPLSSKPASAAAVPEAVKATNANALKAEPYVIAPPAQPVPASAVPAGVASKASNQSAVPAASNVGAIPLGAVPPTSATPAGQSKGQTVGKPAPIPRGTQEVTDEKLRQELLNAVRAKP